MTAHLAQIVWQAPRLLPVAIAIAGAALVAVLFLYVPQARRLRQPWRWGLPLLRLLVGLALAASVAQPALVRSEATDDPGAVVVLVDASRSMSVVDARSTAEQVALADALGLLPAGTRSRVAPGLDDELDTLQRRVGELATTRADLEYAKLSGQGIIAAQTRYDQVASDVSALAARLAQRGGAMPAPSDLGAKLAAFAPAAPQDPPRDYAKAIAAARGAGAAAQSAADAALYERPDVKPVCDGIAKLSRAQLAARALSRTRGSVLASLPASGLYGYSFADALRPLQGTAAAATQPSVEPADARTDVAGSVRAASDRMRGRRVQAIVLLTDGRQVGGESTVASTLSGSGTPVYPIAIGSPAPPDVSIFEVALPQRQFVGETTAIRVQLRGSGVKGQSVEVSVEAGGQRVAKPVTFADPIATVEFPLKFDAGGVHEVAVTVTPQGGEVTTVNNAIRRRVVATSDRATIALVGASASWDFQNVRRLLSRTPWATVEAEVLDAPGARWSVAPSDIAERSVVILHDVAVDHLASRQWDALYRLVAERGGSVVFVAGQNTASPQLIDSPLLTDLLPFRAGARPAWRSWPGEQPLFRFQPAARSGDMSMLKLSGGARPAAEDWLELPAVFQYLPVTELKPNTTPLLVERESGLAVLTDSRLGLGHVIFFGVNETWRWRHAKQTGEHDRFWLQLLRSNLEPAYAVRSGPLRLDVDRIAIEPGESIQVRAKIGSADEPPPGQPALRVSVLRGGAPAGELTLVRDASGAGRYTGVLEDLTAGSYQLELRDPVNETAVATLPVHVEAEGESEMRDVSADHETLRRLAESTGGQFLTLSEWDTLPRRLRAAHQTGRQIEEQRLWDSPQLFAFVLGCLGIEWAMRKRLGLA